MYTYRPSIQGQTVDGVVDGISFYCTLDDVEPVCGEMDMMYAVV